MQESTQTETELDNGAQVGEEPECGACYIEPEVKQDATQRLRRIEGQAAGIRKMIEEDRHCVDVLTQIGSTREALRGVGRLMLKNYLKTCVTEALQNGVEPSDEDYDELLDVIYKFVN